VGSSAPHLVDLDLVLAAAAAALAEQAGADGQLAGAASGVKVGGVHSQQAIGREWSKEQVGQNARASEPAVVRAQQGSCRQPPVQGIQTSRLQLQLHAGPIHSIGRQAYQKEGLRPAGIEKRFRFLQLQGGGCKCATGT